MPKKILIIQFLLFISLLMNLSEYYTYFAIVFYSMGFVSFCFFIYFFWYKSKKIYLNKIDIIVLLISISLVIKWIIVGNYYSTQTLYIKLFLLFLYFPLSFINKSYKRGSLQLFFVCVIFLSVEASIGFLQILQILPSGNRLFNFTGTFGNPAMLATYLSVLCPLLLSMFLTYRKMGAKYDKLTLFFAVVFMLSVYIIVVSKTRGAWLSCFLGCFAVLFIRNKFKIQRYIKGNILFIKIKIIGTLLAISLLVSVGGYGLYKMKEQSAQGRLLIWKIVFSEDRTSVFGKGLSTIEAEYGKWQADYFIKNGISEVEQNTADYVVTIYNTFFEVLIEEGWIGLLLLISLFYFSFFKRRNFTTMELGSYGALGSIFSLMFTSYPFRIYPIVLLLMFSLSVISLRDKSVIKIGKTKFVKVLLMFLLILITAVTYNGIHHINSFKHINIGKKFLEGRKLEEAIGEFKKVEKTFKDNGNFNFYLGASYYNSNEIEKSIFYLQKSVKNSSIPNGFILLGNCYSKLGNVSLAEKYYVIAVHIQPSKIYTKYLLFELFKNRDTHKALYWAEGIIKTKIKVDTTASKEILKEINDYIISKKKDSEY